MNDRILFNEELEEGDFNEDLEIDDLEDNNLINRREAIKKTLMAVAAGAAMMIPMESLADDSEPLAKDKEKERLAAFEKVRKEGLAAIEKKQRYVIEFQAPGREGRNSWYERVLILFFNSGQTGVFAEKWMEGEKQKVTRFDLKEWDKLVKSYEDLKFTVME